MNMDIVTSVYKRINIFTCGGLFQAWQKAPCKRLSMKAARRLLAQHLAFGAGDAWRDISA